MSRSNPTACRLPLAFAVIALLAGCDRSAPRAGPAPAPGRRPVAAEAPAARPGAMRLPSGNWRYTIRGRIVALPKASGVSRDLQIHHEALAAFYDRAGKDVGMKEMIMDFPSIAPDVSLQGLGPGDPVVVDLDVDWNVRDFTKVYVVTRVARLTPDAQLRLSDESPK